ncbi:MAG: phosphate acetyltransferase [Lachnospiraceae bacterium]|nr:phosphate acetyltransferase [Lachnospiraceae bacterium]
MGFIESIKLRAKSNKKTIVLPETADIRTLQAASQILKEDIANIILIGSKYDITKKAEGLSLEGAQFVDPHDCEKLNDYVALLVELRKSKGITPEEAKELLLTNVLYFGCIMVKAGDADGMVAGAVNSSANVLRAALQILKTAPDTKLVSAFFLVVVPNCDMGAEGTFIFSDAGLNQSPNSEELAAIAESSAKSFELLVQQEPIVAMLSHSTKGSARHPEVDKVVEACKIVNRECPDLKCDGELQSDAAIVPAVAASKAPSSSVAGKANVLVFPDLDAGNIGYKLVQRLAKADAYGPITQGIAKPVNDLSRGCSAEDIVGVVAITAVQAQAQDNK